MTISFASAFPFTANVAPLINAPIVNRFFTIVILLSSIRCNDKQSFNVSLIKFVAPPIISAAAQDVFRVRVRVRVSWHRPSYLQRHKMCLGLGLGFRGTAHHICSGTRCG